MQPPIAAKHPVVHKEHDQERVDSYAWLKDKSDPKVIAYLEEENSYCEQVMSHTETLRQNLYDEMLGRIREDDSSVPYKLGDWWIYSRTEKGKPYRIHCRKFGTLEAKEEVFLDENELADGHQYFVISSLKISPDQRRVAWTQDLDGSEEFELFVKDLTTGAIDAHRVRGLKWSLAWGDTTTLFYTRGDSAQRPYQIWRRAIDTPASDDDLVWEEPDERFFLGVGRSRNGRYVILASTSKITSEVRLVDTDDVQTAPSIVLPREQGVEYDVSIGQGEIFVRSNKDAVNFRLFRLVGEELTEVIPHNPQTMLEAVQSFDGFLVLWQSCNGLGQVRFYSLATGESKVLTFPDATYELSFEANPSYELTKYRLNYSSPVTPNSVFSYDIETLEHTVLKVQPVQGYEAEQYVCERIWVEASDGTQVPVSLARRKDARGPIPILLYGYGSYGYSYPAGFRSTWISLFDRGVGIAIAHIRGGADLGREWYLNGKMFHKMNTFTDFIACADHLVNQQYTTRESLGITGGSAGGLLMGAVLNLRPDLCRACVARVPFVDVISTMMDSSLPLTVIEYEEWGNPNELEVYEYMLSYSPYDNVGTKEYPHLMVTAGLNDPRVGYWEPAKWVARLRDRKQGDNLLIFRTHMGAGHGGESGRYGQLRDLSWMFAFVLDRLRPQT